MADKAIKVKEEKSDYVLLQPLRRGSKKDGSAKKVYAKGDKISLNPNEVQVFKNQKLI
jgi:hypothetical protein